MIVQSIFFFVFLFAWGGCEIRCHSTRHQSTRELLTVYIYLILYIFSCKSYHSNPDIVLIILVYLFISIKL